MSSGAGQNGDGGGDGDGGADLNSFHQPLNRYRPSRIPLFSRLSADHRQRQQIWTGAVRCRRASACAVSVDAALLDA